ncbi:MAG: TIM barrel protein, partial [Planctomycetota bacterium]|nr:TIM barrel protein [Planctomycetota bacterium]
MKPAITQLCLDGMSLCEAAEHAKRCGYEGLELRFFEGKDPDYRASDAEIAEAARLVRGLGLDIPSIVAWSSDRGSLLSSKAEERRRLEECISRALYIAWKIGVDGILLHPGSGSYTHL